MTKKSFSDFVNEKNSLSSVKFDPEEQIHEWITLLEDLYAKIRSYLHPFIMEGSTELTYYPVTIQEESLGSYQVNSATLKIGNIKFLFSPVGTMLIGSKGRVDIIGPKGTRSVALIKGDGPRIKVTVSINDGKATAPTPAPAITHSPEDELPWRWVILSAKPPYKFTNLEQESFQNLIMELA